MASFSTVTGSKTPERNCLKSFMATVLTKNAKIKMTGWIIGPAGKKILIKKL